MHGKHGNYKDIERADNQRLKETVPEGAQHNQLGQHKCARRREQDTDNPGEHRHGCPSGEDLAIIELKGDKHVSGPKPHAEYLAHTHIYRLAGKVNAVVQAHPEVSLSLIAARGKTALNLQIDEEAALYLGNVATVQKLSSTSAVFASSIATRIARGNATTVIMEGHGTLAVGASVHEALGRVEMLEHIATKRMLYYLLKGR